MQFSIEGPLPNQTSACSPILRALSDWFSKEETLQLYEQEIDHLPTFLARTEACVFSFLRLKQHTPCSAEVCVMGVRVETHRRGTGRALMEAAQSYLRKQGVEYLQVKSLGSCRPDEGYARTRSFYQAVGFRLMEEFSRIWDEDNPCLIMVKRL